MPEKKAAFSKYQIFVIAVLAILQFSVILDFMVLSPLGAILIDKLNIQTTQFGLVVSAYAFSAGISGFLAAGFADRFDRKKLLLFFYTGFLLGTVCCALAPSYHYLLIARIITGIFGGVIGSVGFAIISDLFAMETRGRVMGFVQMAFSASQVLGIPVGLYLANHFSWHAPFWMIAGFGFIVCLVILIYMKPINAHLQQPQEKNPFKHVFSTLSKSVYLQAFLATTLLATGGFMMMPFGSAYSTNNLGLSMEQLPLLYGITGVFTIIVGPLIGKLSDKMGKYVMFCAGSAVTIAVIVFYTRLGVTPFWIITAFSVVMFAAISSRMISASALLTAVPDMKDRGAFMSINSSIQQLAGGIGSYAAGRIIVQGPNGILLHYEVMGNVVIGSILITVLMMYFLNQTVQRKLAATAPGVSANSSTAPAV
jgi:predicted MFS family arabinose efflux permease